jgi:hypothetical protein
MGTRYLQSSAEEFEFHLKIDLDAKIASLVPQVSLSTHYVEK